MKNTIPTKLENPNGLHGRYNIIKIDGTSVDERAEYFVLRLDKGGEPNHVEACRQAIMTYASYIAEHIPKLAQDITKRWYDLPKKDVIDEQGRSIELDLSNLIDEHMSQRGPAQAKTLRMIINSVMDNCANIALAIDSDRGNESEIYRAIINMKLKVK